MAANESIGSQASHAAPSFGSQASPNHGIVAAIVVAAGVGARLGSSSPKAFVEVGGTPLLVHVTSRFADHVVVRDVVVVAPPSHVDAAAALVPGATVVAGGTTRQESVERGLAALAADVDLVLVHDAARAFVPAEVISRVVSMLAEGAGAVIPTLPLVDTVKRVEGSRVVDTPDRGALRVVQTPQGFRRSVLVAAHAQDISDAPDDASLVEALGLPVLVVDGDEDAFKITVPADIGRAEVLLYGSTS